MSFSRLSNMAAAVSCALLLVGLAPDFMGSRAENRSTNACPVITRILVKPLRASLGDSIDVSVTATDEDGDPLSYAWTGVGGGIAESNARQTTFRCENQGVHTIAVTVVDPAACAATWTGNVTCME